jgi:hypothetical protein
MAIEEQAMSTRQQSLRVLVEKWFAATGAIPVRVVSFTRTAAGHRRCVGVEAERQAGPLTLFFFSHDDGSWQVFPPEASRPAMGVCRLAA